MNPARQNIIWYLCLWLAAICTAILVLPDMVLKPGSIVLQLGGDGLKNFYTYYYHSMYGSGFHFTGMNYPQGEHIVYADGQAFLSVTVAWLRQYIPFTTSQVVAILHLVIVSSYVLAIVYIALLLRYFKTAGWFSIIFAVLIVLLSPQNFRIFGHYGLSYLSVIPMLFYWTVKYHDTSRIKYAAYIFILGTIMAFAHPYFAAVFFIWGALYVLACLLTRKGATIKDKIRHLLPYTASFLGVLIAMKLVMAWTDNITDRPSEPFGILSACTTHMNILTSKFSALWRVLDEVIGIKGISGMDEGLTYIGIVCIVVVLGLLIYLLGLLFKKKWFTHTMVNASGFSPAWLIIALGALLLGMGAPFVWGMEWLLDYLSVFRQFRSLGRFSWIFYYVITVYASVVLYHWFSIKLLAGKKAAAYGTLSVCILLWVFEASGYIGHSHKQFTDAVYPYNWFFSKNEKSWQDLLSSKQYKKTDFQAIMLYPYLHVGTEKIWLEGDRMWVLTIGASAASQMQLPIVNVVMSRSSWSQAFEKAKMAGGILTDKSYLDKVNDKPFLLIAEANTPVIPNVQYLFDASDSIGEFQGSKVYACYPSRIRARQSEYLATLQPLIDNMAVGDTVLNATGDYYIEHFDTGKSPYIFCGTGATRAVTETYANLPDVHLNIAADSMQQEYEFSAWALLPSNSYRGLEFKLELYDSAYGDIGTVWVRSTAATDFKGMWFRLSTYFTLGKDCRHIRCKICNVPSPSYIALDELMIRPAKTTVISKNEKGEVLVNGHLINRKNK